VTSLVLALGLGFVLQLGALELQKLVQRLDEALLAQWSGSRGFDATENQTRIGAIGRLKLSGRILLRIDPHGAAPPSLLRQATYDLFKSPFWSSSQRNFEPLSPEANLSSWILCRTKRATRVATVAGYLHRGVGLLALPRGATRLENLPVLGVSTNSFGSIRVEEGPGFVQFDTAYQAGSSIEGPPSPQDTEVQAQEEPAISVIARTLGLEAAGALGAERVVRTVEGFFAANFTYSTWQDEQHRAKPGRTALARFLLENRTGHCEYFATATVLLLRAAGIPARYATGYALHERKGRYYVVRERHAHAWCTAFIDGAWRDIDTTPAIWSTLEDSHASLWEPVRDLFSRVWFEISRWRWGHTEWKRYILWLIAPLLAFALSRLLLKKQWRRALPKPDVPAAAPLWPGLDSEFFAIEEKLAQAGGARQAGETGSTWLARVAQSGATRTDGLDTLLAFHYRLRFDPRGLNDADRAELRRKAVAWLKESAKNGRSI
jgi:transglutaminase-like putative cysteine protease